jgi:hypothetical protein
MKTETSEYRGYELQAVHNPPMWQVSAYPTSPKLRRPRPDQVISRPTKEEAVADGQRLVDELLAK